MSETTLPPGDRGLPLLGETLDFLKDQFHFVDAHQARFGKVFRSNILFKDTALLVGAEGARIFNDESKVQRSGGMAPHIADLFGGTSLPLLDGEPHRQRKQQVMGAFTREALTQYLPVMDSVVARYLGRWSAAGESALTEDLKKLALEVIARTMVGSEGGREFEENVADFKVMVKAFTAIPVPIPGTAFAKAKAAQGRIFERYRKVLAERAAKPTDDGLSRMLATPAEDGTRIAGENAIKELHHFNLAGYITFAHMAHGLVALAQDDKLRERLRAEIAEHVGAGPITVEALHRMPLLENITREMKRRAPFVAVSFGKAKSEFTLEGKTVPAGWMVMLCNFASGNDPEIFADPERFDPDRFAEGRAEDQKHPTGFFPQGVGEPLKGHKCAGVDFSTLLMKAFMVRLVRDYDTKLPKQDLSYQWEKIPPEYTSGLRAVLSPVRSAP
ncbi:MAG: cytochrome P450 [Deltaproteobacteria bacterium]|nr:cytochrome P450 [Deltaproteobacteria bacterium]